MLTKNLALMPKPQLNKKKKILQQLSTDRNVNFNFKEFKLLNFFWINSLKQCFSDFVPRKLLRCATMSKIWMSHANKIHIYCEVNILWSCNCAKKVWESLVRIRFFSLVEFTAIAGWNFFVLIFHKSHLPV